MFSGKWSNTAKHEMPLWQTIDKLYRGELTSFTEKYPAPTLRELYDNHTALLNAITTEIIPDGYIIPAKITDRDSDEDYIFAIIGAIKYIVWAVQIQDEHSVKWHTEEIDRLDRYRKYLQRYSDTPIKINYPQLHGDTLTNLEGLLLYGRMKHKTNKIIYLIKEHFNIERVRISNRKRIINSINKFYNSLHSKF